MAARGYTVLEIIFVALLIAVLAAVAVPQSSAALDRSRAWAAARYLAARMAAARSHAVMRSASVAIQFRPAGPDIAFQTFLDANSNGVRTRDIASRVDVALDDPTRLSDLFPGVAIGLAGGAGNSDPVRIGPTNLLSFSPLGTATSGTIYVRGHDGSQLAVRIFGATGRTRVLRYRSRTNEWVSSF
jgi:Tfp pilus assembly protein FimT